MLNSKRIPLIIAWTIVALGLAFGGYYFLSSGTSSPIAPVPLDLFGSSGARQVPAGLHEYKDERYNFSLLYPESLEVTTLDEGGGAATITFQNPSAGQGFQIFVVPFFESEITEERFKRDLPTGVRNSEERVVIDGAEGVAFYSKDVVLGDTREVWFINGNYLYEVTTLRALEADLLEILKTWQFGGS